MRKAIIFIFSIISGILCSQPSFDYASQQNSSEQPLGFVKYNNLTILFSFVKLPGSPAGKQRIIGVNNDGSLRFDSYLNTSSNSYTANLAPTNDKGILTSIGNAQCLALVGGVNFNMLTRLDSSGNVVFSIPPYNNIYRGVAQVSATNFIYGSSNQVVRFNGLTGSFVVVVYTTQGNITDLNTTPNKQIIVATNSVVALIDTLGNLLVSKTSAANYVKIKAYKNTFYGLGSGGLKLDKMDSALNIVNSVSTPSNEPITDFSVYNDSMAVSFYNSLTDLSSIKVYPINTFNSPLSFSNNIVKHKIGALQRDSNYSILSSEKKTDGSFLCTGSCKYYRNTLGFTRRQSLADLSYVNDIVLKRIKKKYLDITLSNGSSYNFIFQHSLVVQNNSSDTVKYFRITKPYALSTYYYNVSCYQFGTTYDFDTTIVLNLLPNDSVEIQLSKFSAFQNSGSSNSGPDPLKVCYDLSVPNHRLESNILNSSLCVTLSSNDVTTNILIPTVYPNPATNRLKILTYDYAEEYSVIDLSGRVILVGKETNEIDISAISSGMYIISYKLNGEYFLEKFVKL
jgi:hypothetical protein